MIFHCDTWLVMNELNLPFISFDPLFDFG